MSTTYKKIYAKVAQIQIIQHRNVDDHMDIPARNVEHKKGSTEARIWMLMNNSSMNVHRTSLGAYISKFYI